MAPSRIDNSRHVARPTVKPPEPPPPPKPPQESKPPQNAAVRAHQGESQYDTPQVKANTENAAGGGPAPVTTEKQPLNPRSVQAADHDYDKFKNMGAGTTRAFISLMEKHKGDPDYLAQLVNRAKDKSPGVLDYMMGPLNGAFTKDSGGQYASGFSDADRKTIVDSLSTARSKGYITDQEIRDRAATSPGWKDVADRMGVTQAGVDPSTSGATAELQKAQKAYLDADKSVKEKEERLQRELAAFGPALSGEQQARFIKAFREDPAHKEAYAAQAKAAEQLAQTLGKNREALERAATSDPKVREQLYQSMKAVAQSETPKVALEFYRDISANPSSPLGQAFAQYKDIDKEVLQPAIGGAAGQLLAEKGGDAQAAFTELKALVGPIKDNWEKWGKPVNEGNGGLTDIQEGWAAIEEASQGKYNRLKTLANNWDEKSPLGRGFAVASVVLGAAGAKGKWEKGDYAEAIKDLSSNGRKGLELLAGATKSLADAGKLAQYTNKALSFADFATKLAPGLGLVANSASFVANLQKAGKDGGNIGYAVAALGDALGVMGSAIELIPGGQPVGIVVNGIGAVVNAGGELLGNWVDHKKFRGEQEKFLTAAGVPPDLRKAFLDANGDRVKELSKDLKLDAAQIQELVRDYPRILEGTGRGVVFDNFKKMAADMGLDSNQVVGLLKSIKQGTGADDTALEWFMTRMQRETPVPKGPEAWKSFIHTMATDSRNHEDLRQIYANVDRYLKNQPVS